MGKMSKSVIVPYKKKTDKTIFTQSEVNWLFEMWFPAGMENLKYFTPNLQSS